MLEVNGMNCKNDCFAPQNRTTPVPKIIQDAADKIKAQRAMVEMQEIEEIKQKPKEERTFNERVKLAAYQMDKMMAVINNMPDPKIYVA